MYLSNYRRTLKLLGHLCLKPVNILPYIRLSLTRKTPLELGLPWWSIGAIREMEKHLDGNQRVFEWGSGGSSLFMANRSKQVTTVEQDVEWHTKILMLIRTQKIDNLDVLAREINLGGKEAFLNCPYAKALDSTYDVIIIDGEDHFGPDSNWSARETCFALAEKWIDPKDGIIVVDDSWRYPAIRQTTNAKQIVIHESIGPCRKGVTSTDFHYY